MRSNTSNNDLKTLFKLNGLSYWEVADHIGISESTLIRWLRKELPAEKKNLLEKAVSEIISTS